MNSEESGGPEQVRETVGIVSEVVGVGEVRGHPSNYNVHSPEQVADLQASLTRFGQVRDVVVWRDWVMAGHGVRLAMEGLGWAEMRVKRLPSDWPEVKALAYLGADNELARAGDPDEGQLAALVARVEREAGEELARLAAGAEGRLRELLAEAARGNGDGAGDDDGGQVDRAAVLQEKWGVRRGDVWEVGSLSVPGGVHRVVCGDCTVREDVERLMGEDVLGMVATDPPYSSGGLHAMQRRQGVNSKYKQSESERNYLNFSGDNRDQRSWIQWCVMWLLSLRQWAVNETYLALFSDWRQVPALTDAVQVAGWMWRGVCVWDKTEGARMPHMGYFRHQAEFIVWGTLSKLAPVYDRDEALPGVFRQGIDSEKMHLTQKPVEVLEWLVKICPRFSVVIDPFLGSGTTIVACERTGRLGRGMEIEPCYVAVALERLTGLGLEARRVENGGLRMENGEGREERGERRVV